MSFLNPTYLWALLGLIIPIAIHFWNKKEGKTIKVGSVKLLTEAESKQSSSITLNELWLLFIRMMLLTLIVLIMSEPQLKLKTENEPLTYIIEQSLLKEQPVETLMNEHPDAVFRILDKNFPEVNEDDYNASEFSTPNYWQLAKNMESLKSDSIVVLTRALSRGLKGKRPAVNKDIEWVILESEMSSIRIVEAIRENDNVKLLTLNSTPNHVTFKGQNIDINNDLITLNSSGDSLKLSTASSNDWVKIRQPETIMIDVFYEDEFLNDLNYIEAAYKAISNYLNYPIEVSKTQDASSINTASKYLVWLSTNDVIDTEAKVLQFKPDDLESKLIAKGESKSVMYLTRALNSENVLEDRLAEHLISFLDLHADLQNVIQENDFTIRSKEEFAPIRGEERSKTPSVSTMALSKWLWLLLALGLIVERVIAKYRKQ